MVEYRHLCGQLEVEGRFSGELGRSSGAIVFCIMYNSQAQLGSRFSNYCAVPVICICCTGPAPEYMQPLRFHDILDIFPTPGGPTFSSPAPRPYPYTRFSISIPLASFASSPFPPPFLFFHPRVRSSFRSHRSFSFSLRSILRVTESFVQRATCAVAVQCHITLVIPWPRASFMRWSLHRNNFCDEIAR